MFLDPRGSEVVVQAAALGEVVKAVEGSHGALLDPAPAAWTS